MTNITLSIPDEVYKKMKKYREVRWSEVVRRAIIDYINRLEESKLEITAEELLDELGEDFKKKLDGLSIEKAIEGYEKVREIEWKRISSTQAS